MAMASAHGLLDPGRLTICTLSYNSGHRQHNHMQYLYLLNIKDQLHPSSGRDQNGICREIEAKYVTLTHLTIGPLYIKRFMDVDHGHLARPSLVPRS